MQRPRFSRGINYFKMYKENLYMICVVPKCAFLFFLFYLYRTTCSTRVQGNGIAYSV